MEPLDILELMKEAADNGDYDTLDKKLGGQKIEKIIQALMQFVVEGK